jgi:hypothetical protein
MSALLTPGRPAARRMREGDCDHRPVPTDQGPTLDDVISRAWEVLRADVPAACPACRGELLPRASAGAGIVGGRCDSCGAALW